MPGGKTHTLLTLGATPLVMLASYHLGLDPLSSGGGALVGIVLSPDLDVDDGFIGMYYLRRIFPPLGWVWRALWFPYAKVVGHRSLASHLPLVGTLGRVIYLYIFIVAGCLILHLAPPIPRPHFWSAFAGLASVDALHAVADALVSEFKEKSRSWNTNGYIRGIKKGSDRSLPWLKGKR